MNEKKEKIGREETQPVAMRGERQMREGRGKGGSAVDPKLTDRGKR